MKLYLNEYVWLLLYSLCSYLFPIETLIIVVVGTIGYVVGSVYYHTYQKINSYFEVNK